MKPRELAIGAAGLVLGVSAYRVLRDEIDQPVIRSLPTVAIGWSAIVSGLIAWRKRPGNRMGLLMTAYGLAVLVHPWQYSSDGVVFTIGFALAQVNAALFAHATLAYPTGRVTGRAELWFVRLAYAVALCLPFLTLLFYDGGGLRYIDPGPRSALLLYGNPWLAEHLDQAYVIGGYGVLAAAFVVLVIRKLVLATPRMRRILAPLVLAAGIAGLRALTEAFATLASPARPIVSGLYWWQVVGQILLPIVLLVGLLRTHLARVHVGDLLVELDHTPPDGIRSALARHLEDPSLELLFWLPERRVYVDSAGIEVSLPAPGSKRSATEISREGERVAVIVHDPSLDDESKLLAAAAAAARFALENATAARRRCARSSIQVQESRRRHRDGRRRAAPTHRARHPRRRAAASRRARARARVDAAPPRRHRRPDVERVLTERRRGAAGRRLGAARARPRRASRRSSREDGLGAALESLACADAARRRG